MNIKKIIYRQKFTLHKTRHQSLYHPHTRRILILLAHLQQRHSNRKKKYLEENITLKILVTA